MTQRTRGRAAAAVFTMLILIALPRPGAGQDPSRIQAGVGFDYLSRAVSGDNAPNAPKLRASLVTAQAQIGLRPGLRLTLFAGLSLTDLNGMVFRNLPISLDYEAGAIAGLALGADVVADLIKTGDFVIQGAGSFVYSMGSTKTVPLQDFAVEGTVKAKPTWFQASAGPRIAYTFFGKFVPYVSISGSWLSGHFRMDEALSDLTGAESKSTKGKSYVDIALGADFAVSPRLSLKGRAGFLPYAGGVDTDLAFGVRYQF